MHHHHTPIRPRYYTTKPDDAGMFGFNRLFMKVDTREDAEALDRLGWEHITWEGVRDHLSDADHRRLLQYGQGLDGTETRIEYMYSIDVQKERFGPTGRSLNDVMQDRALA